MHGKLQKILDTATSYLTQGSRTIKFPKPFHHARSEAGLVLPMFPSHQILGTNSSGHLFQKGRTKGQSGSCHSGKEDSGQHSHQLLNTWDPESFSPQVPASIPKDSLISKLQMPREENIYLKPGGQIRMTTTTAQRARPLGLGWPPAMFGDSRSIP